MWGFADHYVRLTPGSGPFLLCVGGIVGTLAIVVSRRFELLLPAGVIVGAGVAYLAWLIAEEPAMKIVAHFGWGIGAFGGGATAMVLAGAVALAGRRESDRTA
jgi:hypothetical protein